MWLKYVTGWMGPISVVKNITKNIDQGLWSKIYGKIVDQALVQKFWLSTSAKHWPDIGNDLVKYITEILIWSSGPKYIVQGLELPSQLKTEEIGN